MRFLQKLGLQPPTSNSSPFFFYSSSFRLLLVEIKTHCWRNRDGVYKKLRNDLFSLQKSILVFREIEFYYLQKSSFRLKKSVQNRVLVFTKIELQGWRNLSRNWVPWSSQKKIEFHRSSENEIENHGWRNRTWRNRRCKGKADEESDVKRVGW